MLPRFLITMLATAMLLFTLQVHGSHGDGAQGMFNVILKSEKWQQTDSSF